jgi:glutathione synthase/RimK-type ligase-like ATP-grasp enzyme
MQSPRIGIIAAHDDIHALAVRHALSTRHGVRCELIAIDSIAGAGQVAWRPDAPGQAVVPTLDGRVVVDELDAIWARRRNVGQNLPETFDPTCQALVDSDCSASVLGALYMGFGGRWVSDPHCTELARDKLRQLQIARTAGLRIPRTLVSSDPDAIRAFVRSEPHGAILKRPSGSRQFVETAMVTDELLDQRDALSASPAMYQEAITGRVHIRAHLFGDRCLAAILDSDRIDWRCRADVSWRVCEVDAATQDRLRAVQRGLGLDMGVYDLKIDRSGEPVFFEVNAQGQFLFIEELAGLALTEALAEHLVLRGREARTPSRSAA